ncbi:MAG TPA: hypothetical protein VFJ74_03970 [Gemmatimonadaceae bacterium]|nr:hypothetical protein [Gemmatimonadaceae bacterium]
MAHHRSSLDRRSPFRSTLLSAMAAGALLATAAPLAAHAQQPKTAAAAPTAAVPGPAVGDIAPDFTLPGATRYGLLRDSVRLSSFRGQTVVLAFFYKARTKG